MNAIKGFTNLVIRRSGDALPDRQKENLVKVDQASDHLLGMINDLLDLSKIEAGRMDVNPSTFDVGKMVNYCVDTVSPLVRSGVALSYDVNGVTEVHTDEARVRQMLINLLSNAIKFTDSGQVKVTVGREQGAGSTGDQSGAPRVSPDHGQRPTDHGAPSSDLIISVSDTGKGIQAEELSTIFDEYRQVKGESESDVQKGTGLGLSITKKFAVLLGGDIVVESTVNEGTTFTIHIPSRYHDG